MKLSKGEKNGSSLFVQLLSLKDMPQEIPEEELPG